MCIETLYSVIQHLSESAIDSYTFTITISFSYICLHSHLPVGWWESVFSYEVTNKVTIDFTVTRVSNNVLMHIITCSVST